jgi:hypothetical protein
MSDLLETALVAHGGRERWDRVDHLVVEASITGAMWERKQQAGVLKNVRIDVEAHQPHVEYRPFTGHDLVGVYDQGSVAITDGRGDVLTRRDRARESFAGHTLQTPWDELQLLYFAGYAIWTYLTTPFLFTMKGFTTREISPWEENGETWRRLEVTFPAEVESHSAVQTFYFGPDGLLRRHDYVTDVSGGRLVANYATEPRTFGGLVIPTKRRAYAVGEDNLPLDVPVGVAIDIADVAVRL